MTTDLFNRLPDKLFRPLGVRRCRLNWQVLIRLYGSLFDEDIEIEEYGHSKAKVVDVIESVMEQDSHLWGGDEEGEDTGSDSRMRANLTYYMLRENGWLDESQYGYHDYVTMPPRVSQLLAVLIEIAEGRPLVMTGKLKSLRSGIREVLEKPRDEADTLIELAKEAGRFSRHLNSIRSSIKELYDRIQANLTVRQVVDGFFDDFLREIFIRDYATIKTTENPLVIRDELMNIVARLRYTPEIKTDLQKGYVSIYNSSEEVIAHGHLERDLSRLEHVFLNIERQFDAIDQMKVRYEQRVDTVIDYGTRSPRTIGRDLQRLALALNKHATKYNDNISVSLPLLMDEALGEARLAQARKKRIPPEPRKVTRNSVSEDALKRSREERTAKAATKVDEEALLDFLKQQLGARITQESQSLVVRNLRDYFCVLQLQRAARTPVNMAKHYPKIDQFFVLNSTEEWVENDFFDMRKVIITQRDKR